MSYIYIIRDEQGHCKIGVSVNPEKRIKTLQTGNQNKLSFVELYELPDDKVYRVERQIHKKAQTRYEKHGEWFTNAIEWDLKVIIEEIIDEFGLSDD